MTRLRLVFSLSRKGAFIWFLESSKEAETTDTHQGDFFVSLCFFVFESHLGQNRAGSRGGVSNSLCDRVWTDSRHPQNKKVTMRKRMNLTRIVLLFSVLTMSVRSFQSLYKRSPSRTFSAATQYTIDCPPTDETTLQKIVSKHVLTLDRFLREKPIAAHTANAFEILQKELLTVAKDKKLVLDSGCGTGRGSLHLGSIYPDKCIVGVDRSSFRLGKTSRNFGEEDSEAVVQQVADNVWLVRSELADFWRLAQMRGMQFEEHYLLYPNPYPKKSRLKSRFYAHAAFPLLLQTGTSRIIVRSNWETYLTEFAEATRIAQELPEPSFRALAVKGPYLRSSTEPAWTNFEKKYDTVGEKTYELELCREEPM
jgi:tRNA (guanine-N7-)-methyltransferase